MMVSSRRVGACAASAALLAVGCAGAPIPDVPAPVGRPNIVVIDIDSMRADRLLARRGGEYVAPRLAALAAQGTVFAQAITQGGWTMPALSALLTGRYPLALRQTKHNAEIAWMPEGAPTLPELLADQGYDTALYAGPAAVFSEALGPRFGHVLYPPTGRGPWRVEPMTRWIAEEAREPFFALLHDEDLSQTVLGDDVERLCTWAPDPVACQAAPIVVGGIPNHCDDASLVGGATDPVGLHAARYDGTLSLYDEALGGLLDVLEMRGLASRTVVVVVSDHGQELGEHGICGHGFLYDTVLRIPLLIVDPRRAGGARVIPWQVQTIDLAPTLLDLAVLPPPPGADGRSLSALMDGGPAPEPDRPVFSLSDRYTGSLRDPPSKLWRVDCAKVKMCQVFGGNGASTLAEVFDLHADPGERHDLGAEAPGAAEGFARLAAWLERQAVAEAEDEKPDPALVERLRREGYWQHVDGSPREGPPSPEPGGRAPVGPEAEPADAGAR